MAQPVVVDLVCSSLVFIHFGYGSGLCFFLEKSLNNYKDYQNIFILSILTMKHRTTAFKEKCCGKNQ